MTRQKIKRRTPARQPYSLARKTEVLAIFERGRTQGIPDIDIIKQCNVSQATLYRWLRETDVRTPKWRKVCVARLNDAIRRLAENRHENKWSMLDAVFTFASWLHWPSNPEYIPTGAASMLSLYALKTEGKAFASELSVEAQQALCRNILLHSMGSIASGFDFDIPVFRVDQLDDQPFTIRDLIGEGCNTLLGMADEADRRFAPSINKIVYLMKCGSFRYKWEVGHGTLEKTWKEFLPAAPFFYIEMYHSSLDWMLYPDSHLFVPKVEELISDAEEFPGYFSRCKAATLKLAASMPTGRSLPLMFPIFPQNLASEPTAHSVLSGAIKIKLSGYRSADK